MPTHQKTHPRPPLKNPPGRLIDRYDLIEDVKALNRAWREAEDSDQVVLERVVASYQYAATNALDVQSACNLAGMSHWFDEAMRAVSEVAKQLGGLGTDWRNQHPISVLYATQIGHLTRTCAIVDAPQVYDDAVKLCEALREYQPKTME